MTQQDATQQNQGHSPSHVFVRGQKRGHGLMQSLMNLKMTAQTYYLVAISEFKISNINWSGKYKISQQSSALV